VSEKEKKNIDPLFQLFEFHLLNRSHEDSAAFSKQVAGEYLTYLDSTPAHLPFHIRKSVLQDLESEAHEMLVKKMYGCVRKSDYLNYGKVVKVEESAELITLDFVTPPSVEESKKE